MTFPESCLRDVPSWHSGCPARLDVAYYFFTGDGHIGRNQFGVDYGYTVDTTRTEALTKLRELVATSMVRDGHDANRVEWAILVPVVRDMP